MPLWSMDNWRYLRRELVTDPKGRQWSIALMDVLGQEGDPEMPNDLLQLQYASGRYFTVVYSSSGALQREQGFSSPVDAAAEFDDLVAAISEGRVDPAQPAFVREISD
jgi:hypothetical protein